MMSFISDTAITAICASIPATLLALAALWKAIKIEHALNGKSKSVKATAATAASNNAAPKAEGLNEEQETKETL